MPSTRFALSRALLAALALVLAACSASSGSSGHAASSAHPSTPAGPSNSSRPPGPAATLTGPVTAGKGISLLSAGALRPAPSLRVSEYFASGTAISYNGGDLPTSGRWSLTPGKRATYRTRIIARIPKDPKRFNGTLVIEWLNVSGGADSDPDYTYAAAELERGGFAYVGVTAQQVGIDGTSRGDVASQLLPGLSLAGLRQSDPARYGTLHHPGDQYSYDIYTQVARALRGPGERTVLGGLRPQRVIAMGESQSAATLTTYVDGVQPLTHEFDAFFIHSRGGGAAPLSRTGNTSSIVNGGYQIRTDTAVPVLMFETESDIAMLRYDRAEQPDTDAIRVWEVAGTSHADSFLAGPGVSLLGCGTAINSGPQTYVVRSALAALDRWLRTGQPPPSAARLVHVGRTLRRDAHGIALGGIRTPEVDVPVTAQSGEPISGSKVICALFGSAKPLSAATVRQLYGSQPRYLRQYAAAADRAIAAGHVLSADRPAVIADAQAFRFPG